MVKEFWTHLCEDLNYRFLTGIPFVAATDLYKGMNPKIMHYIPAANENIAVSLAAGAWIGGFKSVVLLGADKLKNVDFSINLSNDIPVVVITDKVLNDLGLFVSKNIDKVVDTAEKTKSPAFYLIDGELIK